LRDRHSSSFVPGRIPKKNKKKSRDAPLHNHKDELTVDTRDRKGYNEVSVFLSLDIE